jgi:hypothetical protein
MAAIAGYAEMMWVQIRIEININRNGLSRSRIIFRNYFRFRRHSGHGKAIWGNEPAPATFGPRTPAENSSSSRLQHLVYLNGEAMSGSRVLFVEEVSAERNRHGEPPSFATLNQTRRTLKTPTESRPQGLGISILPSGTQKFILQECWISFAFRKSDAHA